MKIIVRILVGLVVLAAVVVAGGIGYLYAAYPKAMPAAVLTVERTPERIARGEYLANHVALCTGCHSELDWSQQPPGQKAGTEGRGGEKWGPEIGMPGTVYSPNLTPAGIGEWSDGELYRAITTGIARDGHALFPLMPYGDYGKVDEEDVKAIIAYLRTLPSSPHTVPPTAIDFPVNLIARTFPSPAANTKRPDSSDKVAYGGYLVTMGGCAGCHTKTDNMGRPSPDALAGGQEFKFPPSNYRVNSANLTPDADTGIGSWTEQQFIDKFKAFENVPSQPMTAADARQNTVMPWRPLAGMTREDLGAIYSYLRTLKPIVNRVDRHPDANLASR